MDIFANWRKVDGRDRDGSLEVINAENMGRWGWRK